MVVLASAYDVGAAGKDCQARRQPLAELSDELRERSFAHVPAARLEQLLQHCAALGGGDAHSKELRRDSAAVAEFFDHWSAGVPQRAMADGSEVYPYKSTLITYYYLSGEPPPATALHDAGDLPPVCRSLLHDYVGPPVSENAPDNVVVERVDDTTATDVGQAPLAYRSLDRLHKPWPADADRSNVMRAFHLLLSMLLHEFSAEELGVTLPGGDEGPGECWEAMQTAFRVTKSPHRHGEPGPEGIHQDACALTVVVLMSRKNVSDDSGGNRVWSLAQACGKPSADDLASVYCADQNPSGRLLWSGVLCERFDAIFLLDRHVKHEALPISLEDQLCGDAVRDVLTFEVRRPAAPRSAANLTP